MSTSFDHTFVIYTYFVQTDKWADRQTDRQTDRETDRQTGRLKDRQADRQTIRQTGRQTHRQTDRQTDRQDRKEHGLRALLNAKDTMSYEFLSLASMNSLEVLKHRCCFTQFTTITDRQNLVKQDSHEKD